MGIHQQSPGVFPLIQGMPNNLQGIPLPTQSNPGGISPVQCRVCQAQSYVKGVLPIPIHNQLSVWQHSDE